MITQNINDQFGSMDNASGVTKSGLGKYPNPFCDIASEYVPSDITTIFEWCEYLMLSVTPFRAVAQRVVRYFLTELVIEGQSDDERDKYEDFLNNKLHLIKQLADIGDDFLCYGQNFTSVYFPFDRFLTCPKCGMSYHIATLKYKFDRKTGDFICDCGKCGEKNVRMRREDRRSHDTDRVRIVRWNPRTYVCACIRSPTRPSTT